MSGLRENSAQICSVIQVSVKGNPDEFKNWVKNRSSKYVLDLKEEKLISYEWHISDDGKEANLITLINPKIDVLTKETSIDWEGCLSVPGLRGQVIRPNKIKYSGLDLKGNKIETIAEGFNARVVQHECDHLFGILYPHRMKDLSSLQFVSEAKHWVNRNE